MAINFDESTDYYLIADDDVLAFGDWCITPGIIVDTELWPNPIWEAPLGFFEYTVT